MKGWSSTAFADVAELVRERTGLVFPDSRLQDVEATIRRTMARLRIEDSDVLLALLRDDARARESFVADLTIGESYFQRDPAQFDLLRWRILPELLASRPADRAIRVWSAGCAAGEEPYTIAMLFEEMNAAHRSDIVGTDIARSRLADAQRGLYSKWQLRNTPDPVRRRYFAEHGKFFELTPRIRQRVDFQYLNLAEDSFPSLTNGIWGMDVILCRNVLIYFDAPTVERVAQRLIASLSEDGWLLLGASDPAISELVDCDVVLTESGLAYRRRGAAGAHDIRAASAATREPLHRDIAPPSTLPDAVQSPAPASSADPRQPSASTADPGEAHASSSDTILDAYADRDFSRVHELAAAAARTGSLSTPAWTTWVRALANEGRHDEAADTVTRAIDHAGATAELLYLHAVLLLQCGKPADAAAAARRALYMDRNLIVAHLTLGEAQRRSGNIEGARRALRNAASLLTALDAAATVPASDGESAGRLAELVRVKLSLLGSVPAASTEAEDE
ncbi:MAG TPA: protein-glutamate O-methyltransferase CheR [Longimicrobiales bacterium]|nr:protein-glutamate O-methyltransferase CheR [Longimicrobiales bacterium]